EHRFLSTDCVIHASHIVFYPSKPVQTRFFPVNTPPPTRVWPRLPSLNCQRTFPAEPGKIHSPCRAEAIRAAGGIAHRRATPCGVKNSLPILHFTDTSTKAYPTKTCKVILNISFHPSRRQKGWGCQNY